MHGCRLAEKIFELQTDSLALQTHAEFEGLSQSFYRCHTSDNHVVRVGNRHLYSGNWHEAPTEAWRDNSHVD